MKQEELKPAKACFHHNNKNCENCERSKGVRRLSHWKLGFMATEKQFISKVFAEDREVRQWKTRRWSLEVCWRQRQHTAAAPGIWSFLQIMAHMVILGCRSGGWYVYDHKYYPFVTCQQSHNSHFLLLSERILHRLCHLSVLALYSKQTRARENNWWSTSVICILWIFASLIFHSVSLRLADDSVWEM